MPRNHQAIDYTQAVLSKYPDAFAFEYSTTKYNRSWQIRKAKGRPLSTWMLDRDLAWENAYRRIFSRTNKPKVAS